MVLGIIIILGIIGGVALKSVIASEPKSTEVLMDIVQAWLLVLGIYFVIT